MSDNRLKIAVPAQILDEDIRTAAVKARQLGVEGLEIPAYTARMRLPDLSATGRREFRHIIAAQQRELAALHVDCGPRGLGPGADVDRVINGVDKAMEITRSLGAAVLTVEVGPLPEPPRITPPKPRVTQDMAGLIIIPSLDSKPAEDPTPPPAKADPVALAQVDDALAELGRRADRYGIAVALHSDLSSHAALNRAISAAACPWFGIDLDPACVLRDEWAIDEVLSRLGPLVRHVRARDAVRGADRRTRPAVPGQGDVNWPELMALLDEAGYHGWFTVDPTELPDRVAAVRAGVERLRQATASK